MAAETQSLLVEIRQIEGDDGPATKFGEAARLILQTTNGDDANRLAKAPALLARVAELRPSWTWVHLLEGDAYE